VWDVAYTIRRVMQHYEVFDSAGIFLFSADSYNEACQEIEHLRAA
jgi:hypothetical protein